MIFIARISKYEEWVNDNEIQDKLILVEGWSRNGLTQQQIADNLGINVDTLIEYKKKYPDFSEALKKGKEVIDIEVENALLKRALGYNYEEITYENGVETKRVTKQVAPDTTAQIFWLKNRKKHDWRDKVEVEKAESIQKIEIINDLPKDEEDGKN